MKTEKGIWLLVLLLVLGAFPDRVWSAQEESRPCLDCHGGAGKDAALDVPRINIGEFDKSVHSSVSCTGCHVDYKGGGHPGGAHRDKAYLRSFQAGACSGCHDLNRLKEKKIHESVFGGEKSSVVCSDCHGVHSIRAVKGGKVFSDEKEFCMGCHRHNMDMTFRSGETMSLKVEVPNSVHGKLACSDCHYGFSGDEHPERRFKTKRDYNIALTDGCRRCHFDKYVKTLEGVHYASLCQGNVYAPVCTDCHGSHSVKHTGDKLSVAAMCRPCHAEAFDVYSKSVHGKALIVGKNTDVPVCTDCHMSHDIKKPLTLKHREQIPDICGGCHADPKVVGRYGLSTSVLKTYLSDFHGVTLELYKQQKSELLKPARPVAVCTDCHGNHNITSTLSPEGPTVKANLVKMCRRCHENATENFPDAWLSHYEPSLARAPMIFIVTELYEYFIPVMLIGMTLQILLHAWRYIVSR